MLAAAALTLALLAPPPFRVEAGVPPEAAGTATAAWEALERLLAAEGVAAVPSPRPVRIALAAGLRPGSAAASRPGLIALRPGLATTLAAGAIRHEVAHQILFEACPAASGDRLFHEAFAVATSGDLGDWAEDGQYVSLARALEALSRAQDLDAPAARRALARLIADAPPPTPALPPEGGGKEEGPTPRRAPTHTAQDRSAAWVPGAPLPRALARRLTRCEAGSPWVAMRAEELADARGAAADALVVLSRHSGEVLVAQGAATLPLPFGSTLKPFLLAGASEAPPRLAPSPSRPGWRCGPPPNPPPSGGREREGGGMDAATALLRSCNGWFLEWAARDPGVVRLGGWGPALTALGLSSLPGDASEAIGIRPSLRISPIGLAQAYRLLAEARPDLVDVLSRSAREGTLAHLPSSGALAGVAAKTGTVLDAEASPRLGWIAAVDRDLVVVMARAGRSPRSFASNLARELERARAPARGAATVQVLGLVEAAEVTGRCAGKGFVAARGGPRPLPDAEAKLLDLARAGPLLCAGGPWLVRYPGLARARAYAGVFTFDPAPPLAADTVATPREKRARRGSDLVFRTTRLLYAAGVAAAEDAGARGEPRVALARVADANAAHSRHPGRAVCDTTHCQVFLGTTSPSREDRTALASPMKASSWLPFSRGGREPWREERPAAAVEAALGTAARALTFGDGRVSFVASAGDGVDRWEERRALPCDALRGPLKLPSCPERAALEGGRFVFAGRGQGHGQGLDLEWAKRSGLSASEILVRAYGPR